MVFGPAPDLARRLKIKKTNTHEEKKKEKKKKIK